MIKKLLYYHPLGRDIILIKRWKWRKFISKGNLLTLDIGCNGGIWSIYCLSIGNKIVGIDIDTDAIQRAENIAEIYGFNKEMYEFKKTDIRNLTYSKNFSQILCFEVIEHIKNDKEVLKKIYKLLKPGGKLLISSPNKKCPLVQKSKISKTEDSGHVREGYTIDELKNKLEDIGFDVIYSNSEGGYFTQKTLIMSRKISDIMNNQVITFFSKLMLSFFLLFDPINNNYPDYTIFIIAKK